MAVITFNNRGVGARAGGGDDAFALTVPAGATSTTLNTSAQFVFYNEADSTVNISFDLNETTHSASTNDQAGNEIFIVDGANQLIMAPLSAAVVTLSRPAASTTATDAATVTASLTTTSHRTVSAEGERLIIETVAN